MASASVQGWLSGDTVTSPGPRLKFNLTVCCCVYSVAVDAVRLADTGLPPAALVVSKESTLRPSCCVWMPAGALMSRLRLKKRPDLLPHLDQHVSQSAGHFSQYNCFHMLMTLTSKRGGLHL